MSVMKEPSIEANISKKSNLKPKNMNTSNDVSYFQSVKNRALISKIVFFIILSLISLVILSPIWWMISTSLKSMEEIMRFPPTFFPEEIHWSNYITAMNAAPFGLYLKNTLIITVLSVIGAVLSNSLIAYGFAKIAFPGKKILFAIILATMMIPGFVTMIPQYVLFARIGWLNTILPLVVPAFTGSAFFTFLLRQFFMGMPNELIEAAKIDGASHFYIWRKIAVPLAKPAISTVAIFSFNGAWNDFLGPLLYLSGEENRTLQLGLAIFRGEGTTQWNYLMAASLLVLVPVVLIFFFFQKYFIQGMNLTSGTKG